jgi:hypothetical protein
MNSGLTVSRTIHLLVVCVVISVPMSLHAQGSDRPTIQDRFAQKRGDLYAHATGMTQIRNDYYDSFGLGLDIGFFPTERIGVEWRGFWLHSALNPAAQTIRRETGLTPDARPQEWLTTAGLRYSFGYGKMKIGSSNVVHFDPQLAVHGGIAVADRRVLPTVTTAASMLLHFKHGVQAKIDLGMALQLEDRARGWVPSIGFAPVIGVGGSLPVSSIVKLFGGGSSSSEAGGEEGGS